MHFSFFFEIIDMEFKSFLLIKFHGIHYAKNVKRVLFESFATEASQKNVKISI